MKKNRHGIVILDKHKPAPTRRIKSIKPSCAMCGRKSDITLHHKKPKAAGGRNYKSNLVPLCKPCHVSIHKQDAELAYSMGLSLGEYYRLIYAMKP